MHVPAAAAAGGAAAAGHWLFSYNRENFQFDAGLRFQRFMAARGYANAQMAQYREDIQGIAEMTVAKMDTWQSVCTLFLCVCAALSCAGRLGMHGAAPPGWLCALYSGNIFQGILFCGLALWLAMHASLRAQCAMVSLLTRKVRLPIPSNAQLDQARVFASSYEKQNWGDILRVPFMKHQQNAPDLPSNDEEVQGTHDFGSTGRNTVPSWIRDEQVVDKLGGVPAGSSPVASDPHEAPEHFKLMAKAMEDWWMYDVYARITMLYGVMCFLYAVSYYSIGTTISELRGFWISWSLPMLFLTAQALILRLDILQNNGQKCLPNVEFLGHLAPYFAITGTTLEFKFWYSPTHVHATWVFVCLAFFGHFMMALRMLDLAWPDTERERDMPEEPTRQWWPASWRVPSGFTKALWLLAPPKKLEVGQHCLMHEMDDLKKGGSAITACRRRKQKPGEPKKGAGWVNSNSLFTECMKLDRSFSQLFHADVWNHLTERSQQHLHSLYGEYQNARLHVDQLPEGSEGDLGPLDETLRRIEAGLEEIASKSKAAMASVANKDGPFSGGSPFGEFSSKRAPDLPWQLTRVALLTMALQWFFMICCSAGEAALGPESLLKPPGEPPWIRDIKTRSWTPAMVHLSSDDSVPADYELFNPTPARPPLLKTGHGHGHGEAAHGDAHGEANAAHGEAGAGHGEEHGAEHGAEHAAGHGAGDAGHGHETSHGAEHAPTAKPHGDEHASEGHGADHSSGHDASHGTSHDHGAGHSTPSTGQDNERRLSAYDRKPDMALQELLRALPQLQQLAGAAEPMAGPEALPPPPVATGAFMAREARAKPVRWPALFAPRHLACGHGAAAAPAVAALTPRGFGAMLPLHGQEEVEAEPFALEGLGPHGALAGAGWGTAGLDLVTEHGELLHCPGHRPGELGTWRCARPEATQRLPVPAGARLLAAAVHTLPGAGRLAAILMDHLPGTVALMREDADGWSPSGEVHLPPGSHAGTPPGLSFSGEELLVATATGEVLRRHHERGAAAAYAAPSGPGAREFRGACGLADGGVARLALAQRSLGRWVPELLLPDA